MADKRLLYMTAQRLQAYTWKAGDLAADAGFDAGEPGVAEFARYLAGAPGSLYYLVADVAEEDFFQENIPYVRGKDRQSLLGRKLAQRYRDTSLAMTLSLGMQEGGRREERILYSSFTNTQQFQPWLATLRSSEARLVGVFSLALIAPLVAKRLNIALERFVLVSVQEGGMRQSYVENGMIRFSRLGRADPSDPRATAEGCAAESNRILQYLTNLRILPREAVTLEVIALVPEAQHAIYQASWGDNPRLNLKLIDLEPACKTAGLKSAPPAMLGERLFLHVLAMSQPAKQYAGDTLRRFYNLWRVRVALLAGGAAVCIFSLLLAGLRTVELGQLNDAVRSNSQKEARITQEYDRVQTTFPKTPLPRESLKVAVGMGGAILRQSRTPDRFLSDISQALAAVPQVELDKLDWSIGDSASTRGADAAKSGASPAPSKAAPPPNAAAPSGSAVSLFEVVEIDAHINGLTGNDYRAINVMVQQFVAALRQRPGLEVIGTRTPYDAITEKPITGEVGEENRAGVPTINVRVSRRIES